MPAYGSGGCGGTGKVALRNREGHFSTLARRAEKQQRFTLVHCLGVDEISLRKGHQQFALVLSDLERHCVIAVLPERTQKPLNLWLAGLGDGERSVHSSENYGYGGNFSIAAVVRSKPPHAQIVL